jgi:hypothetical protein
MLRGRESQDLPLVTEVAVEDRPRKIDLEGSTASVTVHGSAHEQSGGGFAVTHRARCLEHPVLIPEHATGTRKHVTLRT